MKISYYPGCTLFEKAKVLDKKAKDIASLFGYELCEIPDWTCCGAVFPNSLRNIMKFIGPYRMLANTAVDSDKLLTLCSACYNVMKRSNKVIKENKDIRENLESFTGLKYNGEVKVIHYLEFLRDIVTYEKIKEKSQIQKKRKVVPYYGCLILRPYEDLKLDDPDNPKLIGEIINTVGDELVDFPLQNECCGAYLTISQDKDDSDISKNIINEAKVYGGEVIITTCPLCYYNLEKVKILKTVYFTEYLAAALGID